MKVAYREYIGVSMLSVALLFGPSLCFADLDEQSFVEYELGDLGGQMQWTAQRLGAEAVSRPDCAMVVEDPVTHSRVIRFNGADPDGSGITRLLKKFPPTSSNLVEVSLDFTPGGDSVAGRLYIDQSTRGSIIGLCFRNGTLQLAIYERDDYTREELDHKKEEDTGVAFNQTTSNHFKVRIKFDTHDVEVFMNGESLGEFKIAESFDRVDSLNFWGGGNGFTSSLSNLSVLSVTSFSEQ